ncbi:MAG: hypothetical protein R3Y62_07375, partial [Eubacteriales bacterium]
MSQNKWIDDLNNDPDLDENPVDALIRDAKRELGELVDEPEEVQPFEVVIPEAYADLTLGEDEDVAPEEEEAPTRWPAWVRMLIYVATVLTVSVVLAFVG